MIKADLAVSKIRSAAGNPGHVCPTCGKPAHAPYRRVLNGKISEGCVDPFHTGRLSGADLAWHMRPCAVQLRISILRSLAA